MPKVKTVNYDRLFNLGNYEHEKIGVGIELNEGESVQDAVEMARNHVSLLSE
jgi:hypothetical protein